jgi:putative redox protein
MITAKNTTKPFLTDFSNSRHSSVADAPFEKGGKGAGFRPHELLEASLACCMNIWLRMYADEHKIQLPPFEVQVSVNREKQGEAIFEYSITWLGSIELETKALMAKVAETCSVRQTLSCNISFQEVQPCI